MFVDLSVAYLVVIDFRKGFGQVAGLVLCNYRFLHLRLRSTRFCFAGGSLAGAGRLQPANGLPKALVP